MLAAGKNERAIQEGATPDSLSYRNIEIISNTQKELYARMQLSEPVGLNIINVLYQASKQNSDFQNWVFQKVRSNTFSSPPSSLHKVPFRYGQHEV